MRCAAWEGYNLHAGVAVGAQDRVGLERLARYLTRPALARARLEWRPDGLVVVHLERAWTNGTTAARIEGRHLSWAQMLERVFGLDGWRCPHCGEAMRLRTVVMPPATLRVIASLHRSEDRLVQARAPPTPDEASG